MPDPTPTIPAPEAAVPPVAAPAASPPPAVEPRKASLLSTILGLTGPADVDTKPVAAAAPEAVVPPAPAPVPEVGEKKIPVKKKDAPAPAAPVAAPGPSAEEIRRIAAEEAAKAVKPPAPPAVPDDSALTVEEREELQVAALAEAKDPSKKGLSDKFRSFYKAQATFLEGRIAAEGDDYDPAQDPEFKRFAAKHEPKLTAGERRSLREEQVANAAEARALASAEKKFAPELEKLRHKTLELEHRPKIADRVSRYSAEVVQGMPADIVDFFKANGSDVAKTREAFPGEFDIVVQSLNGASALAEEALSLRRGLVKFNTADGKHQYLDTFLAGQADHLLAQPAAEQLRDGKTFVHPYKYDPSMAGKHWTFDDEDVLGMIKTSAQSEAQNRIKTLKTDRAAANAAAARRATAPSGAVAPAPAVPPVVAPSSRTPPVVAPGAAVPAVKKSSTLSNLLKL